MQHSIFEPLFSLQAHNMEECLPSQAAPSLFSISPPSPPPSLHAFNTRDNFPPSPFDHTISCSLHAHIITPPPSSSHYKKARSEHDLTSDNLTHFNLPLSPPTLSATPPPPCSNPKLPLSHSTTFFSPRAPRTACSNNSDDGRKHIDDGSIASKLLSSITKSISSPSLHLQSCKEASRETPYQKTLKLKQMKLQHCAEALGMESSDNSSFIYDSQCIHQEKIDMIGNPSSCPASFTLPNSHQESSLKSVQSAPNLSSALPLMTNHSRYTRSTSFPPPLSHTLPTSSSYDSLSLSLRAYREDGRFILKETMVPSKHYFHANRRNGRLTLHVLTRELIEEESLASQDDHEDFSNKDCQGRNHREGEEEEILESMQVSLNEETHMEEGLDSKEEYSTNTIQSLNEVCVKENLGMEDTSKEVNIAASHLNMILQRLNCLAIHNNKKKDSEDDDKRYGEMIDFGQLRCMAKPTTRRSCPISGESQRNVISNVITLSLQTSSHSKADLSKAQVLSFPHLSGYPLVSAGTLKQSTLIHSAERSQGLLPSNHDMGTCTQSNKNFIWQSNLMHRAVASGSPRKQRKGGGGGSGATLPALVMEEMRAKGLMNVVSELATSLILEASYGRGNWCLAGKKPLLSAVVDSGEIGTIVGGYDSAIKGGDESQISHAANFGYNTLNEEDKASEGGGIKELNITQFPSSNANLQSELEWLHTLHCKELFDRHQLGQGFMKLHCIPTRS